MKTFWRSFTFTVQGHHTTLKRLFKKPPPIMHWQKVEGLFVACGVDVQRTTSNGTVLELNGITEKVRHTPEDEVPRPVIEKTRDFLQRADVTPSTIWIFLARRTS